MKANKKTYLRLPLLIEVVVEVRPTWHNVCPSCHHRCPFPVIVPFPIVPHCHSLPCHSLSSLVIPCVAHDMASLGEGVVSSDVEKRKKKKKNISALQDDDDGGDDDRESQTTMWHCCDMLLW